jgi:hypothetical protein
MFVNGTQLLLESIDQYLILESNQILMESIVQNPRKYFIINEAYRSRLSEEDFKLLEESIWDTIKSVAGQVGDFFSSNPQKAIQGVADIVSIFDPTGLVDLVNGIFYYIFKDYFSAFFSFLGAALTMGGVLLSLTGVGATAGVPMIVAGKASKAVKVAIKTGNIAKVSAKEIGIVTKVAAPALEKIGLILAKIPFAGGIGKWLSRSSNKVSQIASKPGGTVGDVAKVFGSDSVEISRNPVVQSFAGKVVNVVKKQGFKPSVAQTAMAAGSTYLLWSSLSDNLLEKVAIIELEAEFKKSGLPFDINDPIVKQSIPEVVEELKLKRNGCRDSDDERCKSSFAEFLKKYPKVASVLGKVGGAVVKAGEAGANALEKTDYRTK